MKIIFILINSQIITRRIKNIIRKYFFYIINASFFIFQRNNFSVYMTKKTLSTKNS